jgi:Flp pilus assembly protein TadG
MTLRNFWCNQRAATAVEYGITGPLFFFVLFSIVNSGLLLWTQISLQHGAEMGARCASVNKTLCATDADITNYAAQQALAPNLDATVFTVTRPACGVQVSGTYAFNFITSYFGASPIVLAAQSCIPE